MRLLWAILLSLTSSLAFALTSSLAFAAAPGTLISAKPVIDPPSGMQAWRVVYWTTSDQGAEIEVTGMVAASREAMPLQPRQVLAYAHGTSGVASSALRRCRPISST
jgi:hypothetical protein